jgi:hypothetical protein
MDWVVASLARSVEILPDDSSTKDNTFPLMSFLNYYLFARDAVACEAMAESNAKLAEAGIDTINASEHDDLETFWRIVSLIESGHLDKAYSLIKKFSPLDTTLLLGLDLGCILIANLNSSSADDRALAKKICTVLKPRVAALRTDVVKELNSLLLEVRKGKVVSLELSEPQ